MSEIEGMLRELSHMQSTGRSTRTERGERGQRGARSGRGVRYESRIEMIRGDRRSKQVRSETPESDISEVTVDLESTEVKSPMMRERSNVGRNLNEVSRHTIRERSENGLEDRSRQRQRRPAGNQDLIHLASEIMGKEVDHFSSSAEKASRKESESPRRGSRNVQFREPLPRVKASEELSNLLKEIEGSGFDYDQPTKKKKVYEPEEEVENRRRESEAKEAGEAKSEIRRRGENEIKEANETRRDDHRGSEGRSRAEGTRGKGEGHFRGEASRARDNVVDVENVRIPPQINVLIGNAPQHKRSFLFPDGATVTSIGDDEGGPMVIAFSIPQKSTFSGCVDGCHEFYSATDSNLVVRKIKMRLIPILKHFLMSGYATNPIISDILRLIQQVEQLTERGESKCCENLFNYINRSIEGWFDAHSIGDMRIDCNHTDSSLFPLEEMQAREAKLIELIEQYKEEVTNLRKAGKSAQDKMNENKLKEQIKVLDQTILLQQEKMSKLDKLLSQARGEKTQMEEAHQNVTKNLQKGITVLKEKYNDVIKKQADLQERFFRVERERDDYRDRMSRLAGEKLTVGNQEIADLNDTHRPTKLAEMFSELYDNEWTDLFEVIELAEKDEMKAIVRILGMVKELWSSVSKTYAASMKEVSDVLQGLISSNLQPIMANVREAVRVSGFKGMDELVQKTLRTYRRVKNQRSVENFIRKAMSIFWECQTRFVVVVFDLRPGDYYKAYTRSGRPIQLVWPPMFLENGALLCKGIAQGDGEPVKKRKMKEELIETADESSDDEKEDPKNETTDKGKDAEERKEEGTENGGGKEEGKEGKEKVKDEGKEQEKNDQSKSDDGKNEGKEQKEAVSESEDERKGKELRPNESKLADRGRQRSRSYDTRRLEPIRRRVARRDDNRPLKEIVSEFRKTSSSEGKQKRKEEGEEPRKGQMSMTDLLKLTEEIDAAKVPTENKDMKTGDAEKKDETPSSPDTSKAEDPTINVIPPTPTEKSEEEPNGGLKGDKQRKRQRIDDDEPSEEMKAALLFHTRMPDMNIVDPTDTITGWEDVQPEPDLSEQDLPTRPKRAEVTLSGPPKILKGSDISVETHFSADFVVIEGDHYAVCKSGSAVELGTAPVLLRQDLSEATRRNNFSIKLEPGNYKIAYVRGARQVAKHRFEVVSTPQILDVKNLETAK